MCDTAGKVTEWGVLFAKNSDRKVNEPQILEYFAPKINRERTAQASYIQIEQSSESYAFLLSRPVWLWGGEMGVNEFGVAIGNEAVFTKGRYSKSGLTGMDLLRIGLENGGTAYNALDSIISALERYGQGGNCSYEGKMYYDNSFLIADKSEIYILETYNKEWTYKKADSYAISNELTIGDDGDKYSSESCNFKSKYSNPVKSMFVLAKSRREVMLNTLESAEHTEDIIKALACHKTKSFNPMRHMMAAGPCMHGGPINSDGTTASLVAELRDDTRIWATGCSTPCLSLYKPWAFGVELIPPFFAEGDRKAIKYWLERETFHRLAIGKKIPDEFFSQKSELQAKWFCEAKTLDNKHLGELLAEAREEEREFFGRWRGALCTPRKGRKSFLRFWKSRDLKLNQTVKLGNKND